MKLAYEGQGSPAFRGLTEDGRRLFIYSQSQLKQVDLCPERGRATLLGENPVETTEAIALGHSVHEVIELCLTDIIDGQGEWRLDDMIEVACQLFDEEMEDPTAQWVNVKTFATIHRHLARVLSTWYDDVLPSLDPLAVEVNFGPLTVYEDAERVIQIRGQIDYIDKVDGLADWKTSGREWVEWEHKRWDIQPTMYTWGYYFDDRSGPLGGYPWTWHVLNTDGSYQRIQTTRDGDDWGWLAHRLISITEMLEADLPSWPKNDTHALCSPKWCGKWDTCKGLYVPAKWLNK